LAYLMGMEAELTDHQIRQNNKAVRKKWEDALLKKTIAENKLEWFGPAAAKRPAGPRERLAGFGSRAKQLKAGPRARKKYTLAQFKSLTKGEVGQWVENIDPKMYRGVKHKFVRANVTGQLLMEMPNKEMALRQLGFKRKDQRLKILRALKKIEKDAAKEEARKQAEERKIAIEKARAEGRDLEAEEQAAREKAEAERREAEAALNTERNRTKKRKGGKNQPTEADLAQLRANGMLSDGDDDPSPAEQARRAEKRRIEAERRRERRRLEAAEAEKRELHSSLLKQRGRLRGKSPSSTSTRNKRRRDRRRRSRKRRDSSSSSSDSSSSARHSSRGRERRGKRRRRSESSHSVASDVSC